MRILTEGPAVRSASISKEDFSAERAHKNLGSLLEGIRAHPAGSSANKLLRSRIVEQLEALGITPETQRDFQCTTLAPGCSYLENIIAILPGRNPSSPAILATAHYDSAPASGGAADNGAAVAVLLEIITNLKAAPPLNNDIIFLFSDAEESGLRGAMAFNEKHPLMDRVGMILNMEARGVNGPSVMFETGPQNYQQVKGFDRATPRPIGTSLIVEMYKRMPNGTDLMVYAERGLPALNFAFSRGVSLYHSPHDTVENLSKASLQHHGDNMLAAIRYFGNTDLPSLQNGDDATYIDIFGLFLMIWPSSFSIWLTVATLLGLTAISVHQRPKALQIIWAIAATFLTIIGALIAGWLLSFPLGNWGDIHPLDHPYPLPGKVALIASALMVPALIVQLLSKKLDNKGLFLVVWWIYGLTALGLSLTIVGASYIFIAPALCASLVGTAVWYWKPHTALKAAGYAGAALMAYMAFYHFILLDVVFNFHQSHLKIIPLIWLSLAAMPLLHSWLHHKAQKGALAGSGLIALVATAIAIMVPPYTAERPRSTNIVYRADTSSGLYNWQLFTYGPEDPIYLQAAGFQKQKTHYDTFGYKPQTGYLKPAVNLGLQAPDFTLLSDTTEGDTRTITAMARFETIAMVSGIGFSPETKLLKLEADGQTVLDAPSDTAPHALFMGSDPTGLPLKITVVAGIPVKFRLFNMTPLLLEGEAGKLAALRPKNTAPMHFGDHSVVSRTISLGE